jgi:hypothetical protein
MNHRAKWGVVAAVAVVALGGTSVVGLLAWQRFDERRSVPTAAGAEAGAALGAGDRIVFRNTQPGSDYGLVSSVDLDDPEGTRRIDDIACDRVDASAVELACLHVERGIVPAYTATVYDLGGTAVQEWPLPGIPSRTRMSPDGSLVATTSFVTGHSYAAVGFSTATTIHTADGDDLGNLEDWTLLVDGEPSAPSDRNFWGVTFVDDTSFYATVGFTLSQRTALVRGDLSARTLSTVADDVECPSISPDGTRIAFKKVTDGSGPTVHWTPAVLDLGTGEVTLLAESRSIDDQIEWLDDDTILYGMPRPDAVGDSDVWRLPADGSGGPRILLEHAWSPSVVRSGS